MINANCPSRGFALFEVMITVFLLGVGILGLAATQLKTYSITRDADYRTNVALHAEGLAEAMKANPIRSLDTSDSMSWSWNHYRTQLISDGGTTPSRDCHANDCTQAQLAAYDLYAFQQNLRNSFPADSQVYSQICPTNDFNTLPTPDNMGCAASGTMTIKVAWRSKATKNEAKAASSGAVSGTIVSGYQLRVDP